MRKYLVCLFTIAALAQSCKTHQNDNGLSKADLVTEDYFAYQDSLVEKWNAMINDDNQKIGAMQNLLHELENTRVNEKEKLGRHKQQLDQLTRLRYTQKSMSNADVIEEYDFASATLVMELVSLAESRVDYSRNAALQKLVDDILLAEDRVGNYRQDYDDMVSNYNSFIENNKSFLKGMYTDSLSKRSLFQMVSAD